MNKDVFERHTSTGITCDRTFLLPFLYVRRKVNYFPFISPTIFVLSSNKERLIAGYNRRRDLCLDANKFVSLTANSLIEVICLKIWQNHCPKKQNVLFPLTCFAQNRLSWLGSLLQQESLECTLSTFSWTGVSLLPSTTAIDDCHRNASCSLNRAVSCSWSFKEQKEQNEIKTRLINRYRCKIKTVAGVIIRGSIYNVQYKS